MITNTKLYEMVTEQFTSGNGELRDQLLSQISASSEKNETMAQQLADQQRTEIEQLSDCLQSQINAVQEELNSKIEKTATTCSAALMQTMTTHFNGEINKLQAYFDEEIEKLQTSITYSMDERFEKIMLATKNMTDRMIDLQKDTAVIMQTLQLILTNMMLDNVSASNVKQLNALVDQTEDTML